MSDSETDLEDKRARLMKMLNDEERYIYLHLKEKDKEDFRTIFNIFDKDGGGSIEESEIRQVFQSLGQDPTEEEVKTMINSVDENNDGTVDFEEFLLLMAKQMKLEADREEELVDVFHEFDVDGDNKISDEDIVKKFQDLGERITIEQARDMIKVVDRTKDTYLQFSEFVKFMLYDTEDETVAL